MSFFRSQWSNLGGLLVTKAGGIIPPPDCRYYYNFDGVDDYVSIPSVTLVGDYEITGTVSLAQFPVSNEAVFGGDANFGGERYTLFISNVMELNVQIPRSSTVSYLAVSISDLSFDFSIKLVGDNLTLTAGSEQSSVNLLDLEEPVIKGIGRWNSGLYFHGKISDLVFRDGSGASIRSYAIDDNSNTIIDSANGQNGTLINGDPASWEYICESTALTADTTNVTADDTTHTADEG